MSRPEGGPPLISLGLAAFDAARPIGSNPVLAVFDAARPIGSLHGMDRLIRHPEGAVVLCFSEKAADAADMSLPGCACLGTSISAIDAGYVDLSGLGRRHVVIWPDAGSEGAARAARLVSALKAAGAASVRVLVAPRDVPTGWSAFDALDGAWSAERFRAFVDGGAADSRSGDASLDDADVPPIGRLRPQVDWPYPYVMTERGLVLRPKDEDDAAAQWLCDPFTVHAEVRTGEGLDWAVALSFRDGDGRFQSIVVPMGDLAAGDAGEVRREMASKGLRMTTTRGGKEKLVSALAGVRVAQRAILVSKSGWHENNEIFATPSFTATTSDRQGEPVVFRNEGRIAYFGTAGTLSGWQELVASLAAGQSRLTFALALSFAGPMLDLLGQEGGIFNLVGPSSCGKSTSLLVAGSSWGGGGPIGFSQTWKTTANSLEGVCSSHNDTFLGLDELGLCEPKDLEVASYALAGGTGKGRARADGSARARARWRVPALSTGEVTLGQRLAEGGVGKQPRAGQSVRFVDIEADAGRGFGLFDHAAGFSDAGALADALRDRTKVQHGTAGPAFVEKLLAHRSEAVRIARDAIAAFVVDQVPEGASGQVRRVASRFGLVAATGELAVTFGVLPFKAGDVTDAVSCMFGAWIGRRGGLEASETRNAVAAVRAFLEAHGSSKFPPARRGTDPAAAWRNQDIAGYRMPGDAADEEGDFLFHGSGFARAVAGLDIRGAADALADAGFLLKSPKGERKRAERIGDKTWRVYRVRHQILEGEPD